MFRRLAVALTLAAGLWAYVYYLPPRPVTDPADQPAQWLSTYVWTQPDDWFGGFSGIELTDDGRSFYAITDRAYIVNGTLTRSGDRITGVTIDTGNYLRDDQRVSETETVNRTDAEGLALLPDGTFCVSFERVHRIHCYDTPDAPARWPSYTKSWRAMAINGGMELLAIDAQGTLWTMPEKAGKAATEGLIYRRRVSQKWDQPFTLALDDRFLPVGGDFGPDGRFYVLERDVYPFGFRSRIRSFALQEEGFVDARTLLETPLRTHGNLEGLSVWRDSAGEIRLSMIADDNYLFFQQTQIVEYRLTR